MDNNNKSASLLGRNNKRLLLIAAFIFLIGAFFAFDLNQFISYEGLAENEAALKRAVADNPFVTAAVYMAVYITAVAFSLPGALWLSLAGGLMFGTLQGGLLIIISATIGAGGLFLAARYVIGDALRAKAGPALQKFETSFFYRQSRRRTCRCPVSRFHGDDVFRHYAWNICLCFHRQWHLRSAASR